MKIGQREIGNGQPCYIIAEAGTGHVGNLVVAIRLAQAAIAAGADAVKFQMFVPDEPLFCPIDGDERRRRRWNETAMEFHQWQMLKDVCDANGITFLASAFQPTAVQWLKKLNVAAYKVASRAAATYPYDAVPGPFIISDGALNDSCLSQFHNAIERAAIWLHCVMKYPTSLSAARWPYNENRIEQLGLSDHSGTIWPGLDAMACGCPMLEVHFAIDKADAGNDAPVCLSVDQLKLLCEARDAFATLRSPPR